MDREQLKWKILRGLTEGADLETLVGEIHDEVVELCASCVETDSKALAGKLRALKLPAPVSERRTQPLDDDTEWEEPSNPVVGIRCDSCGKRGYKRDWKACEGCCPHCGCDADSAELAGRRYA
ncbi:MAG: hypothetical protein HY898_23815 [Deltaproteobacteria bacterium]|nr:hypothetical protein [Deltaproteobacteria bacterium]